MSSGSPEQQARQHIDAALDAAGWLVQNRAETNLSAGPGVAVREFKMADGHGFADYMLFVEGKAVGVLEAKPAGYPLTSVELQADKYATGLPAGLTPPVDPLPFLYMSTGVETRFINLLDPDPKTRRISDVPHIHQPSTLGDWLRADTLNAWITRLHQDGSDVHLSTEDTRPSSLRARIQTLPPVEIPNLWQNKVEAITNLERSLRANRPRALIQMATGSGKTLLAITSVYRLIKYAGARRVLFLVDRSNLGEQAEKEFQGYRIPPDVPSSRSVVSAISTSTTCGAGLAEAQVNLGVIFAAGQVVVSDCCRSDDQRPIHLGPARIAVAPLITRA